MGLKVGERARFMLLYTGAFAVLALISFSPFILAGNSFVWQIDGLTQHVKALSFYGTYLRDIAGSLFSGAGPAAPGFSFALGYGQDVLDSLNYYVVGDPLNVLAAFVPEQVTPVLYTALVFVRLYLVGIAFAAYAGYALRAPLPGKLAGALTFAFCGFALFAGVRHPYFVNPLIYLPLVLLGVEKVLRERKHAVFALSLALSAVSNFYFFYMVFLVMALYIVMRLVAIHRAAGARAGIRGAAADFGHLVGSGIVGVLISCVVFLPVVLFFLQDTRGAVESVVPLLYSDKFYSLLLLNVSTTSGPGMWTYLSTGIVAVVAIVSLFSERRANTQLKVALVAMFVMLCIPFVGHAFNGFAYAVNRWCWAFSFACACAIAVRWEALMSMSRKQARVMAVAVGAYLVVSIVLGFTRMPQAGLIAAAVLWALSVAAIAFVSVRNERTATRASARVAQGVTLVVVCAGIALNALALYAPFGGDYASRFLTWKEAGEVYETEADDVARLAESEGATDDGGFYRYTASRSLMTRNAGALEGVSSTSSYWSLAPSHTKEFFSEMGIIGSDSGGCCWYNVDGISSLAEMVGVRYYALEPGDLPLYGYDADAVATGEFFEPFTRTDKQLEIHENESPLPFGFTYARTLSEADFDTLEPRCRREAVLQSAVVGDGVVGATVEGLQGSQGSEGDGVVGELAVATGDLAFTSRSVPFKLETGKGVTHEDGLFTVTKKRAQVTLSVDGEVPKGAEASIQFTDLVLDPTIEAIDIEAAFEYADGSVHSCPIAIATILKNTFEPYHWITESPGYSASKLEKVTLTFPEKGTYAYRDIELIVQPMDGYEEQVAALTKDTLANVDMHYLGGDDSATLATNRVTGSITLDEPKVLCTQIPYSAGWSVRVDGEEAELLQVGVLLSGVALGPGEHTLEFVYATPGLAAGAGLSLAGVLLFVGMLVIERRASRRNNAQASVAETATNPEPLPR